MKNRKFLRCIVCVSMILTLCGCSMAVPDAREDSGNDRMIGAFITTEFLDLFDMDRYVDDHAAELRSREEVEVPYGSKYEGRLYAEIDKSKGEDPANWEISFGNLDGMNLLTPLWTLENGEQYWGNACTEGISDINLNLNESDVGVEHSVSGTIYILPGKTDENTVYYANPVYQTEDGKIYVTRGHGVSKSGEPVEGEELSSFFDGETTVTENGKRKTEKSSVAVRYVVMLQPVQITFYQMDQENQVIKQDIYKPEEVPEQFAAEADTEYILVETEKEGLSGEKIVSREVYDYNPDKEVCLTTFCARDDGIVVKQETEVVWNRLLHQNSENRK